MRMKTIMVLGRYLPGSSLFFINIIRLLRTRIKKKQRNDPVNDVITLTKVAENISWLLWDSLHKTAKIAKSSKASTTPMVSNSFSHIAIRAKFALKNYRHGRTSWFLALNTHESFCTMVSSSENKFTRNGQYTDCQQDYSRVLVPGICVGFYLPRPFASRRGVLPCIEISFLH